MIPAPRPCPLPMPPTLALWGLMVLACSSPPTVVVTIAGLPQGTRTLVATATFGGMTAKPERFDPPATQFALQLPVGSSGQVQVGVEALIDGMCLAASGTGTVQLPSNGTMNLMVTLERPAANLCPLSVSTSAGGSVTSDPMGIQCDPSSQCSARFAVGSTVVLRATSEAASSFNGWSGTCSGNGPCVFTMAPSASVAAAFAAIPNDALAISKGGDGTGVVTSNPAGVSCGQSCIVQVARGTVYHLSAQADSGSIFQGWSGACSGTGACAVTVNGPTSLTASFTRQAGWITLAPMTTARYWHTATLLPNGKVLVAGGNNGTVLASAELYDPASNSWSPANSLSSARDSYTATLLPNGKVLVAGGISRGLLGFLASAELYDPASNSWSAAASLSMARASHTATLLPSGKVLVTGGNNDSGILASAELYDPASNSWSAAASLASARVWHTASLLPNGKVLVAGPSASTELYDPASNSWSAAASLVSARDFHTATLLPSGKVLASGGYNGGYPASAELYDPASNSWSAAGSLANARAFHTATLLPSGKVLVAGGSSGSNLASAELYDPASNSWSTSSSLSVARSSHTATLLPNGKVLVAGGGSDSGGLSSAELYTPVP